MIKFSQIKDLKSFCDNLFSTPDYRGVLACIINGEEDFEVDNVRFISSEIIDETLADELESDTYDLGCFCAQAIAHATGWPIVLIEAAQKGEAFEAIGDAMTRYQIEKLADYYSSVDGYGHRFNRYDGGEEELLFNGIHFHVFDNR